MKRALITGIAGQDGSYLAELLLEKGYEVHGIVRRSLLENKSCLENIKNILDKIHIHTSSLDNHLLLYNIVSKIMPHECYHLAAESFVNHSLDDEISAISTNFNATYFLLSSIKEITPDCRFYFAGSSEMFGNPENFPQNENTQFNPRSIYGISKLSCYHLVKNYREKYGMYACTGIAFNHESPRRGDSFVTKKIISGVKEIVSGKSKKIPLGNINNTRDWGYAPDYVNAMWLMLNTKQANDYVIATGKSKSIKDFLEIAFSFYNLDYKDFVVSDKNLFRETERIPLVGDAKKINTELGWIPKTEFKEMIKKMLEG